MKICFLAIEDNLLIWQIKLIKSYPLFGLNHLNINKAPREKAKIVNNLFNHSFNNIDAVRRARRFYFLFIYYFPTKKNNIKDEL